MKNPVSAKETVEVLSSEENDDFGPKTDESPPPVERDPDYVEERYRVDRRKLEQMIQQGKHSVGVVAS